VTPAPTAASCQHHPQTAAVAPCARCGTFFCAACLSAVDGTWQCASCVARGALLPWDERDSLGLWRAWWRTAMAMISQPVQTLARAQPDGSIGSSLGFALIAAIIGLGPTFALYGLVLIPMVALSAGGEKGMAVPMLASSAITLFTLGGVFVAQVVGVIVLAGLDHLALLLLGGQSRGFSVSVRASALAMSPSVIGLIPVCGLYVVPVWALVLRILALRAFHQTSGGKATAAVLLPTVVLCGGFVALYALVLAAVFMTTAGR
jgi:hypothetical protein